MKEFYRVSILKEVLQPGATEKRIGRPMAQVHAITLIHTRRTTCT